MNKEIRNPFVAGLINVFVPGVSHLYVSRDWYRFITALVTNIFVLMITLALAQQVLGTATSQTVLDLVNSVLENQPARGLETIHRALDSGADPRSLARQIVEYMRGLMLMQMGNPDQVEATREVKTQMQTHANTFNSSDVLRMMKIFNNAATDLRGG